MANEGRTLSAQLAQQLCANSARMFSNFNNASMPKSNTQSSGVGIADSSAKNTFPQLSLLLTKGC
jgi:hypothetical protein